MNPEKAGKKVTQANGRVGAAEERRKKKGSQSQEGLLTPRLSRISNVLHSHSAGIQDNLMYRIGTRRNKERNTSVGSNQRTDSRQGWRGVVSDFSLQASVLFGPFHLFAQHYSTSVTTRSYERPYGPIRSLIEQYGEECLNE